MNLKEILLTFLVAGAVFLISLNPSSVVEEVVRDFRAPAVSADSMILEVLQIIRQAAIWQEKLVFL
jgi:hypothetical protein